MCRSRSKQVAEAVRLRFLLAGSGQRPHLRNMRLGKCLLYEGLWGNLSTTRVPKLRAVFLTRSRGTTGLDRAPEIGRPPFLERHTI